MFVRRARFQAAVERNVALMKHLGAEEARADAAEQQLAWMRGQIDRLTDAFIPTPQAAAPVVQPEKKHDPVMEVVATLSGSHGARRAHLSGWVKEQRAQGLKDGYLIDTLMHWPEYDPGEAEEVA